MEGANVTDIASAYDLLKTLAAVYSVAAVGYAINRVALFKRNEKEIYTLSDPSGHEIRVTLEAGAPPEERARVMDEAIRTLAAMEAKA
jgi:hypothetical protein